MSKFHEGDRVKVHYTPDSNSMLNGAYGTVHAEADETHKFYAVHLDREILNVSTQCNMRGYIRHCALFFEDELEPEQEFVNSEATTKKS